jgi:hypothetical protein
MCMCPVSWEAVVCTDKDIKEEFESFSHNKRSIIINWWHALKVKHKPSLEIWQFD